MRLEAKEMNETFTERYTYKTFNQIKQVENTGLMLGNFQNTKNVLFFLYKYITFRTSVY